jgi:hypothetical protein
MIFGHLWCPASCSAKCGRFVTGFFQHVCNVQPAFQRNVNVFFAWFLATFVTSKRLLNEMWMFSHRIYAKIIMALSEEEK